MSDNSTELRRTLERICAEPRGEARSAALEAHIDAVDAAGDQPLLNETLAALVNSYEYSMDSTRILVPFARLLRNYDTAPQHFGRRTAHSVYWMFKWVIHKMIEHPEVPLDSIEEWLERMRGRYAEAGHSLHPVHEAEHALADHLGDQARAAKALAAITSTEPDRMSNCAACRCHRLGRIAADDGRHERAIELWKPVLEGGLACAHEPHAALAGSLLPLTALGRLDQARANHLHGYLISRSNDDMLYAVAKHLRFCALTGNEARAVEIIAAHARFYELELSPQDRRYLLESVQLTCAALLARGMGGTEVPGPRQRHWRADELHAWAEAERQAICDRYDRRNGNDAQSRTSRERASYVDAYPHVPLGLKTLHTVPAPKPVAGEPEEATPELFETALARARRATAEFAEDTDEHWRRVDRIARRLGVELEPADAAEAIIASIDVEGGLEAAVERAAKAREAFLAAGLDGRALTNRASVLVWSVHADPEAAAAEAQEVIDAAERIAPSDPASALRARALAHIALLERCRHHGQDPDQALRDAIDAIDTELAALPEDPRAGHVRARLTLTLASMETDPEARTALMRAAFEQAEAGDHSYEAFIGAVEYASILNRTGDFEEGLRVAQAGVARVKPGLPAFPVAAVHLTAAECAVNLGRWDTAEHHALQAAAHYDLAKETGCAGVARHLMGIALASQGRCQEAIVVFEAALADLPSMDESEHWRLADVRFLLACSYEDLNEPRTGAEHALEALRLMDGGLAHPNPTVYPRAAHLAGRYLQLLGDGASAVECYGRAEAAWRELGALPTAANSIRAAVWAEAESDESASRESGSATMRALADELRSDWRNGELPPAYREACRDQLGETLLQYAGYLDAHEASVPMLREALAVLGEGELLARRAVAAAHRLMHRLADAGDLAGAEACADTVLPRLADPEFASLAAGIRDHLRQLRDANGQ
ncbi:ATP-binding protein [Glycomyces tarimensis]